jgi:hypothetical protein
VESGLKAIDGENGRIAWVREQRVTRYKILVLVAHGPIDHKIKISRDPEQEAVIDQVIIIVDNKGMCCISIIIVIIAVIIVLLIRSVKLRHAHHRTHKIGYRPPGAYLIVKAQPHINGLMGIPEISQVTIAFRSDIERVG